MSRHPLSLLILPVLFAGEVAAALTERTKVLVLNSPSNPLEWTRLKNVPAGFGDGVDDVGGAGDGHSLDSSDGNPTDVVRVDDVGMVESGFSSELASVMDSYGYDYALTVGGANVWGGLIAESQCSEPFSAAVLGGTDTYAGVLGAAAARALCGRTPIPSSRTMSGRAIASGAATKTCR